MARRQVRTDTEDWLPAPFPFGTLHLTSAQLLPFIVEGRCLPHAAKGQEREAMTLQQVPSLPFLPSSIPLAPPARVRMQKRACPALCGLPALTAHGAKGLDAIPDALAHPHQSLPQQ
ncbi:hypothetical protein CPLU01_08252 [Colletotrichum plurivorum]|uniref:Uncharacterized protein n=1 Tax=Colletotrichum plurivorum TaxID=2175906 RepID=A0A8H6KDT7_9PEZI|nr:hypothetical protein CPLU01_08252 [Colletotrichum plurivorum]